MVLDPTVNRKGAAACPHEADPARALVSAAQNAGLIGPDDERWAYNAVLAAVGAHTAADLMPLPQSGAADDAADLDTCLQTLFQTACTNGVRPWGPADGKSVPSPDAAEFGADLLGRLMPRPTEIDAGFWRRYAQSPQAACAWFYGLCCAARAVSPPSDDPALQWEAASAWGPLEITVNLAKPELDPRAIAWAARTAPLDASARASYPLCRLCPENEGYAGRLATVGAEPWPVRTNLRLVPLELGGERWYLQYSPHAYFTEHCIVISQDHRPMVIDRAHIACLLQFVDAFPHYFMGSNADLPIVGGSLLAHDHFQGGRHTFPLMRAPLRRVVSWPAFPQVRLGVVTWPVSVLRLESADATALADAAAAVLARWRNYRDETVGIIDADADGTPHNTLTPIAYRQGDAFVLDLTLRCNVTSPDHPLGVFHPHAALHHIKKENIGLIEVMGRAILPGRLHHELSVVAAALEQGTLDSLAADPAGAPHVAWAHAVAMRHNFSREPVAAVLREEVGAVFAQVLADAGVFKEDEAGREAFDRFLAALTEVR